MIPNYDLSNGIFRSLMFKVILTVTFTHFSVVVLSFSSHQFSKVPRSIVELCHHHRNLEGICKHRINRNAENLNVDEKITLDRRIWFQKAIMFSSMFLSSPSANGMEPTEDIVKSSASLGTKPFATIDALKPAVRVKLCIDRAIIITSKLNDNNPSEKENSIALVQELEDLLIKPQNYLKSFQIQGVPKAPSKKYLEAYKPMAGDLPLQRYLIQSGDVSTWKDLKKKEKEQEKDNEIRAALNAYTDVLSFSGDSYLLNVDKATRSSMVRQDRLPDIKQVITSDMGMRYLYRNQILTSMDDVRAELQYQLKSSNFPEAPIDATELLILLTNAQGACERWFSLIGPDEVQQAISAVQSEV